MLARLLRIPGVDAPSGDAPSGDATRGYASESDASELERGQKIQRKLEQSEAHVARLQRRLELSLLRAKVGEVAFANPQLDELLRAILALCHEAFTNDVIAVYLVDEESHIARLVVAVGTSTTESISPLQREVPFGSTGLLGSVLTTGQAQLRRAGLDNTDDTGNPMTPGPNSIMALPLHFQGELLGVVEWRRQPVVAFSGSDIASYQSLADTIAQGIGNALRFMHAQSLIWEANVLSKIGSALAGTLSVNRIYRRTARVMGEQLNADRCAVYCWEKEVNSDDSIVKRAEYMRAQPDAEMGAVGRAGAADALLLSGNVGTRSVLVTGEPQIQGVQNPLLETSERLRLIEMGQSISLEVAITSGQQSIGTVQLFRDSREKDFTPAEIRLAQRMARRVATALENAQAATEARNLAAQLGLLNRFSRMLSAAATARELFITTQREISDLVDVSDLAILLLNGDKGLQPAYSCGGNEEEGISPTKWRRQRIVADSVLHTQSAVRQGPGERATNSGSTGVLLGIPLIAANGLIGVLLLENGDDEEAFSEQEVQFLTTIAGPLAASMQSHQLIQDLQEALVTQSELNAQLVAASDFSAATANILDEQLLAQRATELIRQRFHFDFVGLLLVESERGAGVLRAASGQDHEPVKPMAHTVAIGSDTLVGMTLSDGQMRHSSSTNIGPTAHAKVGFPGAMSELVLPLKLSEQVIGILHVQSRDPKAFSDSEVRTLRTISDGLAVAVNNAQLVAQKSALAHQQKTLNEISARLHRSSEMEEIIDIGLRALSEQLSVADVEFRLDPAVTPAQTSSED